MVLREHRVLYLWGQPVNVWQRGNAHTYSLRDWARLIGGLRKTKSETIIGIEQVEHGYIVTKYVSMVESRCQKGLALSHFEPILESDRPWSAPASCDCGEHP